MIETCLLSCLLYEIDVGPIKKNDEVVCIVQAWDAVAVSRAASARRRRLLAALSPRLLSQYQTVKICSGARKKRVGSDEGRSALGALLSRHVFKVRIKIKKLS